jgi:hypothetical protein
MITTTRPKSDNPLIHLIRVTTDKQLTQTEMRKAKEAGPEGYRVESFLYSLIHVGTVTTYRSLKDGSFDVIAQRMDEGLLEAHKKNGEPSGQFQDTPICLETTTNHYTPKGFLAARYIVGNPYASDCTETEIVYNPPGSLRGQRVPHEW